MANPAYIDVAKREYPPDMLPELLVAADALRETMRTDAWNLVQESIEYRRERLMDRLTHQATKAEDIDYLRGQIEGLKSMREAADAILSLAEQREKEARAQEPTHV